VAPAGRGGDVEGEVAVGRPTARSRACLHRSSNAQAVSKTGEAAHSLVLMASAS